MVENRLQPQAPEHQSQAGGLPEHGRINCAICHAGKLHAFDKLVTESSSWRITNNPLAWGAINPDVVVLGFSKGPTQNGALERSPHNEIAYKGGRTKVAKILHHLGLIEQPEGSIVSKLIADQNGQFHFGSLVRCTVERHDANDSCWKSTGGGMLDKFMSSDFGRTISLSCGSRFLGVLPDRTRLIVMMGMGTGGNYIRSSRQLFESVRGGSWRTVNEVSYADEQVVVVHTEHFASQGALLPNWLSGTRHPRGRLGLLARQAVGFALNRRLYGTIRKLWNEV